MEYTDGMNALAVRLVRKAGESMSNIRLFPKYLLSHSIVVVLTALIIAVVSFGVAKKEIEQYAKTSARVILDQTGALLEKKNSEQQINLVAQLDSVGVYKLLRLSLLQGEKLDRFRLERQLNVMMMTNRWIKSILLIPSRGDRIFLSSDGSDAELKTIQSFPPAAIRDLHGRAYWYISDAGSVFFCKMLYDLETTESFGMLAICVDESFFNSLSAIENSRGTGAFFVVSTYSRQVIYRTRTTPDEMSQLRLWLASGTPVPARFSVRGMTYLASSSLSENRDWQIINVIPSNELSALSSGTGLVISVTALASLLVALALAFFLVRTEVGKITTLVKQTHLIADGNFRLAAGFRTRDELGELAAEISSMSRKIGELVERVASEKNKKTEADLRALRFEYNALQSMINPHFIANTLEMVNSTAKIRGVPEIGDVVCLLSDLLRETIRRKDNLIRLGDELEHCRKYLKLQEMLRESRLDVFYSIPDSLLDCLVPNLILQPIVENAIIHGIEPKIGPASITVAARTEGDRIEISIVDDGVGMSAEQLTNLQQCQNPEPYRKIGFESVDKRIKILFGPSYGAFVYSWPGEGTSVILRMPLKEAMKNG